ncbi:hypothetical protein GCM10023081_29410 [Arthrobacter ginkgonis]|uniref:Uncharacterized protein n=1 Tax=Arthrobacter ginkgonis TaxID=1630594 RepID=A0ABP7CGG4_9MICC
MSSKTARSARSSKAAKGEAAEESGPGDCPDGAGPDGAWPDASGPAGAVGPVDTEGVGPDGTATDWPAGPARQPVVESRTAAAAAADKTRGQADRRRTAWKDCESGEWGWKELGWMDMAYSGRMLDLLRNRALDASRVALPDAPSSTVPSFTVTPGGRPPEGERRIHFCISGRRPRS